MTWKRSKLKETEESRSIKDKWTRTRKSTDRNLVSMSRKQRRVRAGEPL
jgi:hypothetical protein